MYVVSRLAEVGLACGGVLATSDVSTHSFSGLIFMRVFTLCTFSGHVLSQNENLKN